MQESNTKHHSSENGGSEAIDWEQRPGGMLVQKREDGVDSTIHLIKIKVFHDSYKHDVTVPAQSTFGELKRVLVQETGLASEEQRLLFRGKEKDDDECLHMAGVKDTSKVVLLQDPASRERKLEQMKLGQELVKGCKAVGIVRVEVDKIVEKVNTLESSAHMSTKVADQEFVVLTELLMRLLLKLDGIEADGEAKMQRRTEILRRMASGNRRDDVSSPERENENLLVLRVQHYVEMLDALRVRNSNNNATLITTEWHAFDSGVGSMNAPAATIVFTEINTDWEKIE